MRANDRQHLDFTEESTRIVAGLGAVLKDALHREHRRPNGLRPSR